MPAVANARRLWQLLENDALPLVAVRAAWREFGSAVQEIREASWLRGRDVAADAGISASLLSAMETGRVKFKRPVVESVERLCAVCILNHEHETRTDTAL